MKKKTGQQKEKRKLSHWYEKLDRAVASWIAPLSCGGAACKLGRRLAIGVAVRFWLVALETLYAFSTAAVVHAELDALEKKKAGKSIPSKRAQEVDHVEACGIASDESLGTWGKIVGGLAAEAASGIRESGWISGYGSNMETLQSFQDIARWQVDVLNWGRTSYGLPKLPAPNHALRISKKFLMPLVQQVNALGGTVSLQLLRECLELVEKFEPDQMQRILVSDLGVEQVQAALKRIGSGPGWEVRRAAEIAQLNVVGDTLNDEVVTRGQADAVAAPAGMRDTSNNIPSEPKPSSGDVESAAQVADWRASIERDHAAMLYIKQAMFLEQVTALTDAEFEHVVKRAKVLARDTLLRDTTPAPMAVERFGKPVTAGQLSLQLTTRNIINVAGKLRRVRASARGGC